MYQSSTRQILAEDNTSRRQYTKNATPIECHNRAGNCQCGKTTKQRRHRYQCGPPSGRNARGAWIASVSVRESAQARGCAEPTSQTCRNQSRSPSVRCPSNTHSFSTATKGRCFREPFESLTSCQTNVKHPSRSGRARGTVRRQLGHLLTKPGQP